MQIKSRDARPQPAADVHARGSLSVPALVASVAVEWQPQGSDSREAHLTAVGVPRQSLAVLSSVKPTGSGN